MPYTYPGDHTAPDATIITLPKYDACELAEALNVIGYEAWTEADGVEIWAPDATMCIMDRRKVVVPGTIRREVESLVFGGWNWRN